MILFESFFNLFNTFFTLSFTKNERKTINALQEDAYNATSAHSFRFGAFWKISDFCREETLLKFESVCQAQKGSIKSKDFDR